MFITANNTEKDIIIIGGGTAGTAAAIAAGRRGHRVLLVEEANCLGGTSTAGGVGEWFAALDGLGDIFASVINITEQYGARFGRMFNPEYVKIAWQLLAEQSGAEILFHSTLLGARTQGGRICGIDILSCSQTAAASAKYFIDASGEGDLAFHAGAEFMMGDPVGGRTLHMSLGFMLFDTGRPVCPFLPDGFSPIRDESELPGLNMHVLLPDKRVYCNMTKVMNGDPTDPYSLSKAELEVRRQMIRIIHYLQTRYYPTHALGSSGARIGIREGRRIIGDYVLCREDILGSKRKIFPDAVAVATSQIDFHSLTKPGNSGWREAVAPYAIPFRCLTAKGIANLLVAGKCISADQVVQSSCRMTPTCCAMGQAAGTAAAMAVESGISDIRQLNMDNLRVQLQKDGMELDPQKHVPFNPSGLTEISDAEKGLD